MKGVRVSLIYVSLSRISNISMEVSLDADDVPEGAEGEVARLVEACECPLGYAGLSCQVRENTRGHRLQTLKCHIIHLEICLIVPVLDLNLET